MREYAGYTGLIAEKNRLRPMENYRVVTVEVMTRWAYLRAATLPVAGSFRACHPLREARWNPTMKMKEG